MNERIKQLARQSTGASTIYMLEEEWLKFAELIVKECADKCLEMAYVNPGPHHYAAMLKENFGVES
jgi:hypothetical protein